jgi:hypothetical protein
MDNYADRLKRLNDRALKMAETGQVFWIAPETGSPLLLDMHGSCQASCRIWLSSQATFWLTSASLTRGVSGFR